MPSTHFKGYALIDCNNFYVSCERIFQPHLNYLPVAVLSNNDGCIIARSQEIKDLKIPMGAPVFLYKELLKQHNATLFSSNFELYGDISQRVMQIIAQFSTDIEIYSIDEAFVPISHQTEAEFHALKQRILKWVGIPVSIGLGPTKTLAKAANAIAKKRRLSVFSLFDSTLQHKELKDFPVEDVWGIGKKHSKKLKSYSIQSALDFCSAPEDWVRKRFNLPGLRTALELKGIPCLPADDSTQRKSCMYSKSFGKTVTEYLELKEAVCHYAAQAAHKIRRIGCIAQVFTLYLKQKESTWVQTLTLPYPSNDTLLMIKAAQRLLKTGFKKGCYLKAGICLSHLSSERDKQLFFSEPKNSKTPQLNNVMDQVNARYGQGSLMYGCEGLEKNWISKREHKTRHYTQSLKEALVIHI